MAGFTRGFAGRGARTRDARLPPGQYDVGADWPVLTAEATPHLSTDTWTFRVEGAVGRPTGWTWAEIRALPPSTYEGDREIGGSVSTAVFLRRARAYVPALTRDDLVRAGAGVRAQALHRDGSLADDFVIDHQPRMTLVRNAPSPAATASLAIAEHIVREMADRDESFARRTR